MKIVMKKIMKISISFLCLIAAGFVSGQAVFAQSFLDPPPGSYLDSETTGLDGFDVEVNFVADNLFISSPDNPSSRWGAGLLDIALAKGFGDSGEVGVLIQARQGKIFGPDTLCPIQDISNIGSRDFLQVSEYWWARSYDDSGFSLKVGKQDLNADLCALDRGGDFLHSSFGVVPTMPIPTYPDPAIAVSVAWDATEQLTFKAAVADGDSYGGTCGLNSTFDGEGGLFTAVEAGLRLPESLKTLGTYRVGYWLHTGNWEALDGGQTESTYEYAAGWYVVADQQLWSARPGDEDATAFNLVLQVGRSPEDRIEVPRYHGVGITVTGLQGRIETVGLGVARVGVLSVGVWEHETAIEAYARFWITPQLTIQPDVQYIINPGADGSSGNIMTFGFRFGYVFAGGLGDIL